MQVTLIERELGRRIYSVTTDGGTSYTVTHYVRSDVWRVYNGRGTYISEHSATWLRVTAACNEHADAHDY